MEKYQNKDDYDEFLKYRKLIDSKIDEQSRKSNSFFKKFRIYQTISLLFTNKFSLMNRYVNSSYFGKIYYELKYRSQEDVKDFRKNPFAYVSHKVLNFFSLKRILNINNTRNKFKAIVIKLLILFIVYHTLKMLYYRRAKRNLDKNYNETLRLFKELKAQNDEILKNNQMIMEENVRLRGRSGN